METMKTPVFGVAVVIISVCRLSADFVFIQGPVTWPQAQNYCRVHFTDLLPIANAFANNQFRWRVRSHNHTGWIGLYRELTDPITNWRWSGGGPVTFQNWKNAYNPHVVGYWTVNGWRSSSKNPRKNFYCFQLFVVGERKSWEEALKSCRENHTSLTTMTSKTELLLAKTEIQQEHITYRVWIGLRFMGNRWMWMNRDPLSYRAWPEASEDHQCPVEGRCGALTKQGLWENRDCEEKLNFLCS